MNDIYQNTKLFILISYQYLKIKIDRLLSYDKYDINKDIEEKEYLVKFA
jgi:hypothetical protein